MKRICTKLFTLLTLATTLLGVLLMPQETSAKLEGGYGVPLTGTPVSVDSITLYGVTVTADYRGDEGDYNDDDYYVCRTLVERFYKKVFGVNIWFTVNGPKGDSGTFRLTNDPKVGDIIYYSDYSHVALVKERQGNKVIALQQNGWKGNHTTAWVNAVGRLDDETLLYYTWDPGKPFPPAATSLPSTSTP